jgi:hypothetical protein
MFYFMESAIIIFFARLVHFQGREGGGCEKEYSLYACDNDEKDGWPLRLRNVPLSQTDRQTDRYTDATE